jgi:hypothetical protein
MRTSDLRIDNPCHEDWDGMRPQGARRFCDRCDKHVHNLSAMTADDAKALLAQRGREGRLCVRYTVDASGTVLFKQPKPEAKVVPVTALSRHRKPARPSLAPVAAVALALAACTPHKERHVVGELESVVEVQPQAEPTPPPPVVPPVVEPPPAPEPETYELMGDIAVEDEPCDPPPVPAQVKMGKIKAPR